MSDQAQEQSLESRIAEHFGAPHDEPVIEQEASEVEEPEAEVAEEASSGDEVEATESTSDDYEEVEYEGEKYQVPPKLAKAIMQERDYTQKSQQVAEQRRNIELQQKEIAIAKEEQAFQASVADDLDNLKMMDSYIKHLKSNNNWAEMSSDEIVRAKLEIDQLTDQRDELQKALNGKYTEFKSKVDSERQKIRKEMGEVLSKAIPKWSDETKQGIEQYVKGLGVPEAMLPNMNALEYQVAWKAMQYDQLIQNKSPQKPNKAPPVVRTGASNPMPNDVKEKLNFKKRFEKAKADKTISDGQRARLIEERLEQKLRRLS